MAAQIGRLGAWEYDVSRPHVIWSEEVCAIHEVRRGFQPTPAQAVAFFAPECQETMRDLIRTCLHDGSPFDVEAQVVTAKGRRLWARVICEAEWDAQGGVRRLQGACQDISESRQAAEETRLMAEQLTTTLESLTDAFFTIDRDWKFSYLNAQAQRMLRRPREQLLGRSVWTELPQARSTVFHRQLERAMAENVAVQCEEH